MPGCCRLVGHNLLDASLESTRGAVVMAPRLWCETRACCSSVGEGKALLLSSLGWIGMMMLQCGFLARVAGLLRVCVWLLVLLLGRKKLLKGL